jgi:YD repeat-containing protein
VGSAVSTTHPTTLYTYDADGNLKSVSDPNGMTTAYSYNNLNELTDEVVKNVFKGPNDRVRRRL